jgi:hypothetical protein
MKTNAPLPKIELRRALAEQLLGDVEWTTEAEGYCRCPGANYHTTTKTRRECVVRVDGAPTVICLHTRCAGVVAECNARLRSNIGRGEMGGKVDPPTVGEIVQRKRRETEGEVKREQEARIVREVRETLPVILRDFAWGEADAWEASRIRIEGPPAEDGALFLRWMYAPDEVLWIGDRHHSGKSEHSAHFKTTAQWLADGDADGPLICPAVFRAGVNGRTQDNIEARPYLVLEGDATDPVCAEKATRKEPLTDDDKTRNRVACLAVLNWCRLMAGLDLRAVVDSGSKSLHGWFDLPDQAALDELKLVLPALGFDAATLRPAQPVRLPGVRRCETGRWQRLLYLNPKQLDHLYARNH